jgi:hypothetical protein
LDWERRFLTEKLTGLESVARAVTLREVGLNRFPTETEYQTMRVIPDVTGRRLSEHPTKLPKHKDREDHEGRFFGLRLG